MAYKDETWFTMKRFGGKHLPVLPYILICGAVVLRLGSIRPYNLIPVFSCLLFFAAARPLREFVWPLSALVSVDIVLTVHQYGYSLTAGHAVTWIWYLGVMFLGAAMLGNSISTGRVLGSSLLASVSFFAVSNFTVWAEWGMYPKTWGGLGSCYLAALPFFRNSIISEAVCSLAIFAIIRHSEWLVRKSSLRLIPADSREVEEWSNPKAFRTKVLAAM